MTKPNTTRKMLTKEKGPKSYKDDSMTKNRPACIMIRGGMSLRLQSILLCFSMLIPLATSSSAYKTAEERKKIIVRPAPTSKIAQDTNPSSKNA